MVSGTQRELWGSFKMKKIAVIIFLFAVAVTDIFGGEVTSRRLPSNLNNYIKTFSDGVKPEANKERIARDYYVYAQGNYRNEVAQFASLDEDLNRVDTAIEWLYTSYYHIAVRDIRPAEADTILPADNPRLVDLELGAVTMQEIKINRFLGNTAAEGRYRGGLKFITDRKNVTEAEVEAHYRDYIRGLIAEIVDEEFNEISFMVDINARTSYNCVLTRNAQNQYILSYESYFGTDTKSTKTLPITSLEAFSSEMSKSGDFPASAINTVREQARLIPAAVLSDATLTEIANILTRFYTEPNQSTYTAVLEALYVIRQALPNTQNLKYSHVSSSYEGMLSMLNRDFAQKVFADLRTVRSITILTREQQQRLIQLR
jgi:hypothetical protein